MPEVDVENNFFFQFFIRGDNKKEVAFPVLGHLLVGLVLVQLIFEYVNPFIRREAQYVPHHPFALVRP